ncbi:hypothetical protein Bxe_A2785 [Paraburkholderia xenovorans LB400]|uniref:Uncharacterized protein n=1 Tax=Paraburkholderia xenovorans (strain LB400) TaxID=266265 RepID=Q140R1_PARXL|nr:hypothetical protein Bxe_A2785 [Paraburkholderia xenovorans LB400]
MAEKDGASPCLRRNKPAPARVISGMAALHRARGRPASRLAQGVRALMRRFTMKVSRILSAVFVVLALAAGTLATSACTTDGGASGTSGGNSSGGGY